MFITKKEIKKAKEIFEKKGCYEESSVTIGSFSNFVYGIEENEFFPAITNAVEFICDYESIDGEISLGVRTNAGSNCMSLGKLKLNERTWIPRDKVLEVAWESLIKEFDEEVFPIKSEEVFYAKNRKGGYVFWERDAETAYLYKGFFSGNILDEDGEAYEELEDKSVMLFEVGVIRRLPTGDSAGFAHSGRKNSWGMKIGLPKKHTTMPWKDLREEILGEFKKIVFSVNFK